MRHAIAVSALSLFLLGAATTLKHVAVTAPHPAATANRVPVVVELFTSEGCSSCPPADGLLASIEKDQPFDGAEVIALEEHVDYWDNLGWTDPFSSHDWTARQYAYSSALGNGNAYTPQMVVNGELEFVGSHAVQAQQAILHQAQQPRTQVTLASNQPDASGMLRVSTTVQKLQRPSGNDKQEVWLAVTESLLHSAVKRGENAGEDLHHASVVRTMRKLGEAKSEVDTSFAGEAALKIPDNWKRENLRAIVFVQEKKSRRILGAAAIRIS